VIEAYQKAAAAKGRSGDATKLDCRPAFDDLLFCLTKLEGDRWRYSTVADLQAWGLSSAQAHTQAAAYLRKLPLDSRLKKQTVQGVAGAYFSGRADDGRDVAPLLTPDALQTFLGGSVVVALPAQGAVIAWVAGRPELDKVMAVGVRKIYDQASHPITPRIYRWGKEGWEVWGEAVKPEAP
jgi:hypothetical protein